MFFDPSLGTQESHHILTRKRVTMINWSTAQYQSDVTNNKQKKLKRKDRNLKLVIIITSSAKGLLIPFALYLLHTTGHLSARE